MTARSPLVSGLAATIAVGCAGDPDAPEPMADGTGAPMATTDDDAGPSAGSTSAAPTGGGSTSAVDDTDGTDGSTSTSDGTDGDDTGPVPGDPPPLQGYGTDSDFGGGGETCVVTTTDPSGPGSLADCVVNRDTTDDAPTPRTVTFEVSGAITLDQSLVIRQPHLTIDGTTAPDPGITIQQVGDGSTGGVIIGTWAPNGTCAHDVLLRGLRIAGTWTPDQGELGDNYPSLVVDGENLTGCIHHLVFDRMTVIGAVDSAGDIWGSATDITIQYSAFLNSYHPSSWSHFPGGEPGQGRERISAHHNLYANNHERNPQIRAANVDINYEQNIVHNWDAHGFGGGYAIRIRCRNGACPQRMNFIANHFTEASVSPAETIVLGEVAGDDPDQATIAAQLFLRDNHIPAANLDMGSAAAEFPRPPVAEVDLVAPEDLPEAVMPFIGVAVRTAEEDAIFDAVAAAVDADL